MGDRQLGRGVRVGYLSDPLRAGVGTTFPHNSCDFMRSLINFSPGACGEGAHAVPTSQT